MTALIVCPLLWLLAKFLFVLFGILLWLFFAVHAMQRLDDPIDRAAWLCFFVFFFYVAPLAYFLAKYRRLLHAGRGSLVLRRPLNSAAR